MNRLTRALRLGQRNSDIGGWILRGGVAFVFIAAGFDKFSSDPRSMWVGMFDQIALGQWFRYFTGVVEVAGGLLYLVPATCLIGAVLLSSAMIGAAIVHIVVRHSPGSAAIPIVLLVAIVLIALREPDEALSPHSKSRTP